jgi:hypothetical protein
MSHAVMGDAIASSSESISSGAIQRTVPMPTLEVIVESEAGLMEEWPKSHRRATPFSLTRIFSCYLLALM